MLLIRGPDSGRGGRGGRGRRFRGGRPKVQPFIGRDWKTLEGEVELILSNAELEALRLVDEENMTQEQAAEKMHISRGTLWRILQQARRKIFTALNSGKTHIHLRVHDESE